MMIRKASGFALAGFVGLAIGLLPSVGQEPVPKAAGDARAHRAVYLAGGLSDEQIVILTAAVAAADPTGVVLLDSDESGPYNQAFLAALEPTEIVPVGSFPKGVVALQQGIGTKATRPVPWVRGPPDALWQTFFPEARRVVVCPAEPRGQLLQAACLAGAVAAPLVVLHTEPGEVADLHQRLTAWHTREIYAAGSTAEACQGLPHVHVVELADEQAVAACYVRHQRHNGPIRALVVANPADTRSGRGGMSALAPWVALQDRAALVLSDDRGTNVAKVVEAARRNPHLRQADSLVLVAGLKAIPTQRRPNPQPGYDPEIEVEPLTPTGYDPVTFATGRLFHSDRSVVALMVARRRLLENPAPRKAFIIGNAGRGLPLVETLSRYTARELQNRGYQTTGLFGGAASPQAFQRLLADQDLFLWEGHHTALMQEYGLAEWTAPLRPSLFFFQSCYALNEEEAPPLLRCGAIGVIGSSTRTYSATGGALALAYFDALLYDAQSTGGSLRQAKNFLLCYALLKQKRMDGEARMNGANLRSAWAFTLWGDPMVSMPAPRAPEKALPALDHEVHGNTVLVRVPEEAYAEATGTGYVAEMRPNTRLAGLVARERTADGKQLIPLYFVEVHLPHAPEGKVPVLHTTLPGRHWVFNWDARRRVGYLLMIPNHKEQREVHFHVHWEAQAV